MLSLALLVGALNPKLVDLRTREIAKRIYANCSISASAKLSMEGQEDPSNDNLMHVENRSTWIDDLLRDTEVLHGCNFFSPI